MDEVNEAKAIESEESEHKIARNLPRILVAEDDKEMRSLLALKLRSSGYEVLEAYSGWNLLELLSSHLLPDGDKFEDVDLIISDIRMPGVSGLEVLEGMQKARGFPPMILITAFGDDRTHEDAARFGAAAMFDKPFPMDDLLAKVKDLLQLDGPVTT